MASSIKRLNYKPIALWGCRANALLFIRSYLKNRILVQDRGGAEFQTGGIRLYVEDLKRGTNPAEKGGRPKDIFEMASSVPKGGR
jgi:hypothetical protein